MYANGMARNTLSHSFPYEIRKMYFRFYFYLNEVILLVFPITFTSFATTYDQRRRQLHEPKHDNFCTHGKWNNFVFVGGAAAAADGWRQEIQLCTMHNVKYFYGINSSMCIVELQLNQNVLASKWNWPLCCWWLQFSIGHILHVVNVILFDRIHYK